MRDDSGKNPGEAERGRIRRVAVRLIVQQERRDGINTLDDAHGAACFVRRRALFARKAKSRALAIVILSNLTIMAARLIVIRLVSTLNAELAS